MEDPFRADDVAREARIERLERDLAQARSDLTQILAMLPENGDAYIRRLLEENAELHQDCERLGGEVAQLRTALGVAPGESSP